MSSTIKPAVKVFISYSHKDEKYLEELLLHLIMLKRNGIVDAWHDRRIDAGAEWDADIKKELEEAQIILLLVSTRFLASRYIWEVELEEAMNRHRNGTAVVIPIILTPCDWRETPFKILKALPKDGLPVSKWENQDDAFLDTANGIKRVAKKLQAKLADGTTSENVPNLSSSRTSTSPIVLVPNNATKHSAEIQGLKEVEEILVEKLGIFRKEYAILAGGSRRFELKKHIEETEADLKKIQDRLAQLHGG